MSNLSDYFVRNENDLISKRECMVMGNNYRFTILTDMECLKIDQVKM